MESQCYCSKCCLTLQQFISHGKHCSTYVDIACFVNHHKMHAVLHKTPPTWCKVHANVVIMISIPHTLGFQCWQSEWGWSHRLGAGTRSQVGRKHADTLLPARGPHMSRLWREITRVDKPSSSGLTVVKIRPNSVNQICGSLLHKCSLKRCYSRDSNSEWKNVQCNLYLYVRQSPSNVDRCLYATWRRPYFGGFRCIFGRRGTGTRVGRAISVSKVGSLVPRPRRQLSVAFSTEKRSRAGRAWERGYKVGTRVKMFWYITTPLFVW